MERERLLRPFLQAARGGLVDLGELPDEVKERPLRVLVSRVVIGSLPSTSAKNALVLRRMSFARFSSRFSR
jgi:hypothetical protein